MTWNLISSTSFQAGSTSSAISGTGADLIVICYGGGSFATPTDSSSNTYTLGPSDTSATNSREGTAIYYCHAPTVTGSMTFTAGTTPSFSSATVMIFSGSLAAGGTDGSNSGSIAYTASSTQIVVPSITTTINNDLVIAAVSIDDPAGSTISWSNSFTLGPVKDVIVGTQYGISTGYLIQSTAGSTTTTWTRSTAGSHVGESASIIAFKGAALAAGNPNLNYDWPNPTQPFRMEQTWIQSARIPNPIGGPFNQFNWPNSYPVQWYQNWSQSPKPQLPGTPGYQHDWPNPYPVTWYQTWTQSLKIPNPVGGPFNQFDWPVPKTPQPIDQFFKWEGQQFYIVQPSPFAQYDWPNPRTPQPIDQTWVQEVNRIPVFAPFAQYDWPVPKGYQPIDQTWLQQVNRFPANILPFAQYYWPLTPAGQPIDQTWLQSIINLYPPPPPPPPPTGSGRQITEAEVAQELRGWWDKVLQYHNPLEGLNEFSRSGGYARAESLTAAQRTGIAKQGAQARWK